MFELESRQGNFTLLLKYHYTDLKTTLTSKLELCCCKGNKRRARSMNMPGVSHTNIMSTNFDF